MKYDETKTRKLEVIWILKWNFIVIHMCNERVTYIHLSAEKNIELKTAKLNFYDVLSNAALAKQIEKKNTEAVAQCRHQNISSAYQELIINSLVGK